MNTAEKLQPHSSLIDLIQGLVDIPDTKLESLAVKVTGIQMDSRLLKSGDLFIACFGRNHDARNYIDEALALGVNAVLAESGGGWQGITEKQGCAIVAVDELGAKISEIASRFYGHPSEKLTVFGITGTNGKTSCSQFIAQVLTAMGNNCGVMGTLGYGIPGSLKETVLTTPDAVFTQMALAEMCAAKIDPVAMEVSSVGLHQKRVAAVKFDTALFTNLSRDHLDYHDNMESYAANKRILFTMPGLKHAVINLDDSYALSMINAISGDVEILTYSTENKIATVHAESYELTAKGYRAIVNTPLGSGEISGRLIGYFNFSNVLAVLTALIAYLGKRSDVDIHAICEQLSRLKPVNGRMEIVGESDDITAIVDYAHTPEGLRSALVALGQHFTGKIWCVFGCGGNRDRGKRPLMGEIAEQYADHLILTDDNPRNEEGDRIIEHIVSGISKPESVMAIRDRAEAINYAISHAVAGDVVLVAGKGHENYQESGGHRVLFSDANQVRLALKSRTGKLRG